MVIGFDGVITHLNPAGESKSLTISWNFATNY